MFFMNPEQLRIAASNAVGVIYVFLLCVMYMAGDKRTFLIMHTVAKLMLCLMYAIGGMWISFITLAGVLMRNIYNTTEKPKVLINILILTLMTATALLFDNADHSGENPLLTYFPLASVILGSLMIMFVKSYPLVLMEFCADSVLWAVYDLKHAMIMALTADLIGLIMPAAEAVISYTDKHFTYVTGSAAA